MHPPKPPEPIANPVASESFTKRPQYKLFVKYSRRLTAVFISVLLARWALSGLGPVSQIQLWLGPVLAPVGSVPVQRSVLALATLWFAFLTQLKVRWFLWLPIYLAFGPLAWLLWQLSKLFGKALVVLLGLIARFFLYLADAPLDEEDKGKAKTSTWSFPTKRVWLVVFFLWLVALRGLPYTWMALIPPALAVPVWFFFIKQAYQVAVRPKTFVATIAKACESMLDGQIKAFAEAKDKSAAKKSAAAVYQAVNMALKRYSQETMLSVIQREAMIVFTVALVFALGASTVFWGSVASALLEADPHSLDAYAFFQSNSRVEAFLWAWGCMTTTINFPGSNAGVFLKMLHAVVLLTGLIHFTFFVAWFSIMVSPETQQRASEGTRLIQTAREKLAHLRPATLQPGFQSSGDRRPVPERRRLELRQKVCGERKPEALGHQQRFEPVDQPIPIVLHGLSCSMQLPRILFIQTRDAHDPPASAITLLGAREQMQQPDEIQPIRLRASRTPVDFKARGLDHAIAHSVRLQPSMQPKSVTARFITADDGDRWRQPESDFRTRDLFLNALSRSSWNVANTRLLPKPSAEPEFPGPLPELERQQQRRRDRR